MDIQTLVVTIIVVPSIAYAAWSVMPDALRVVVAKGMLHAKWPARTTAWLQKTAAGSSGCGCSGCDNNPAAAAGKTAPMPPDTHVVRFHPRAGSRTGSGTRR